MRPEPEAGHPADAFVSLREIETRAWLLRPREEPQGSAAEAMARELESLLDRTIRALLSLDAAEAEAADTSFDAALDDTLAVRAERQSTPPKLADLCFPAVLELKRMRTDLLRARPGDDLSAVNERAASTLRRAIGFVLAAGDTTGGPASALARRNANQLAEVESALAVRRLYADFRLGLRRPAEATSTAVLAALRYAAGALARLVSAPEYADVRASDRALLRHLRDRILAWGQREQTLEIGLHLLDDVWTTADLLRDINRRQELRAHDLALMLALLNGVTADAAPWFARLSALRGLDDALDGLLARANSNEPLSALIPSVLERLRLLV